jgi:hypothetical protein
MPVSPPPLKVATALVVANGGTAALPLDKQLPLTVASFGAVCDSGQTDNAAAFVACAAYCKANDAPFIVPRSNGNNKYYYIASGVDLTGIRQASVDS